MGLFERVRKAGAEAARSQTRLDVAERVTPRSAPEPGGEQVRLADTATVQGWLRQMGPDETVLVHRHWGTIAVRTGRRRPVGVYLSDGANAWFAVPPGADDDHLLDPVQVEQIVLEAMRSPDRPAWPRWVELS
ncbi:MAG TPA: hypothetical protein VH561_06230 [Micromonosporaceae bacterium]|jgi:hypothetical protein